MRGLTNWSSASALPLVFSSAVFFGAPLSAQVLPVPEVVNPPEGEDPNTAPLAGPSPSITVYDPDFFNQFAPRNALNMLENVPGFSIQQENNARGLGQASGNVLINGQRSSSKSLSTRDQLSRISADNVIRVEIVDGASLDIPGLSGRVANVISSSSGGITGQFAWHGQAATGPAPIRWGQADLSVSGTNGPVTWTVALENPAFYGGSGGPNFIQDRGTTPDPRENEQKSFLDRPTISGSFGFDIASDVSANLNLSYNQTYFRAKERERRTQQAAPLFDERLRTTNDEYSYEIGGDIQFPFGAGQLKLIALESYESGDFVTTSRLALDENGPETGSRFGRASDEGERIGRAELSWPFWGADWQLSVEAAFNRLDNVGSLFGLGADGEFFEIPFPAGTGGVREDRYEAMLSYGRPLTSSLSLQLAAGAEYSKIAQTGANALARTFKRPKGSLSLAWEAAPGLDVSFEAARRVGQLNFGDFLAQVNLGNDNTNAGNNQLRPQQSWEYELGITKDLGEWGSATLRLYDHRIEDYVTIVPLPGGGESSGNIESARRYGLGLNATIQLGPVGIPGAKLDLNIDLEESSLIDPVDGTTRRLDFSDPRNFRLDFRHDVPDTNWAWGTEFRDTIFAGYYRVTEIGLQHNPKTFAAIFVEHKDVLGMTVRFRAANLLQKEIVLQRTVFDGPRNVAPILFTEDRQREIGLVFNLDISGSF